MICSKHYLIEIIIINFKLSYLYLLGLIGTVFALIYYTYYYINYYSILKNKFKPKQTKNKYIKYIAKEFSKKPKIVQSLLDECKRNIYVYLILFINSNSLRATSLLLILISSFTFTFLSLILIT